jgi:heptaprenyl diphosphate synthase
MMSRKIFLTASPGDLHNPRVRKTLAMLGAFCLFLSAVEYMIPKPLPFIRIGIANMPLMLALDIFPFVTFLVLVGIKVLGQALITGTLFSYIFLFSLAGTVLSAVSMYALRRLLGQARISFIGTSTAGAMMSNITQLLLARVFIFGNNARYIAPPLLAAGLITGIVLGWVCEMFTRRSQWYAAVRAR